MADTKPTLREGGSQLVVESSCSTRKEEIRALLVQDTLPQTIHTLHVSSPRRDIDILYKMFSNDKILNQHLKSNQIMASQSVIKVTSLNIDHQYVLEAITPAVSYKIRMTEVNNSNYQYLIEVLSPSVKPHQFNYFSSMFNCKIFSDVTLCVSGRELLAHKIILAIRSPVFAALLDSGVRRIDIKDISYDTLFGLVYFIYNGVSPDYSSTDEFCEFSKLLEADTLYCVEGLKALCEDKLSLLLTIENAVDCLILADANGSQNLKQQTINFIIEYSEQIAELPSFERLTCVQKNVLTAVMKLAFGKKEPNV